VQWEAKIEVTLKKSVLDPQGAAVEGALKVLAYNNVYQVRIGKSIELFLEAGDREEAAGQVEEMCRRLLSNPVIEDFTYTLAEVKS
jgi:phosphoribosylformylglycinamidine synthase subunit PurS